MATSPGQKYVAVGTIAGEVVLLKGDEARNPKLPVEIFTTGQGGVDLGAIRAVALGKDGHRVLAGTHDASGATLHLFDRHHLLKSFDEVPGPVRAVAVSPDSLYGVAAVGGANERVVVLDLNEKSVMWDWAAPAPVTDVAVSAGGQTIAVAMNNGAVALFTKKSTFSAWKVPVQRSLVEPLVSIDVDDAGRHVAAVTKNGKIHFLSPVVEGTLWSFDARRDAASFSMAPNAAFLALGTDVAGESPGQAIYFAARRAAEVNGQTKYEVRPGEALDGAFTVSNTGNRVEAARVSVSGLGDAWKLTFAEGPYTVAPGGTITIGYTLKASLYARPGADGFDVLVDLDGLGRRVLPVTAQVLETRGVGLDLASRELTVRAGHAGIVSFSVVNLGNVQETVRLKATGVPAGVAVSWGPGATLDLGPYGVKEVTFRVEAAQGMAATDVPVTITATSDSNVATEQVRFKVLSAMAPVPSGEDLAGAGDAGEEGDGRADDDAAKQVTVNRGGDERKKGRKVPGFGSAALLGAVGGALLLAGRRRKDR